MFNWNEIGRAIRRKIEGPTVPFSGKFSLAEGKEENITFFQPVHKRNPLYAVVVEKGTHVIILGENGVDGELPARAVYVVQSFEGIDSMGAGTLSDGRYIKILDAVPIVPLTDVRVASAHLQN